jgi:hypothetical protein
MVTWSTPTLGKLQMPWVHIGHIKYGDFKDISNGDTTSKSMNRLHFVERGSSKAKKNRLLIFCTGWISLPHVCYIYILICIHTHLFDPICPYVSDKKRDERGKYTNWSYKKHTSGSWYILFAWATYRNSNWNKLMDQVNLQSFQDRCHAKCACQFSILPFSADFRHVFLKC